MLYYVHWLVNVGQWGFNMKETVRSDNVIYYTSYCANFLNMFDLPFYVPKHPNCNFRHQILFRFWTKSFQSQSWNVVLRKNKHSLGYLDELQDGINLIVHHKVHVVFDISNTIMQGYSEGLRETPTSFIGLQASLKETFVVLLSNDLPFFDFAYHSPFWFWNTCLLKTPKACH